MLHISETKNIIPERLHIKLCKYLLQGHILTCKENDAGCYDALLYEDGKEFWVETTLDCQGTLEDCCCSKCNSTNCFHTAEVNIHVAQQRKFGA